MNKVLSVEEREYDPVFFKNSPLLNILKVSEFRKVWIHSCIYGIACSESGRTLSVFSFSCPEKVRKWESSFHFLKWNFSRKNFNWRKLQIFFLSENWKTNIWNLIWIFSPYLFLEVRFLKRIKQEYTPKKRLFFFPNYVIICLDYKNSVHISVGKIVIFHSSSKCVYLHYNFRPTAEVTEHWTNDALLKLPDLNG